MSKLEKFVKTMRIKRRKTCEKAARQKKKGKTIVGSVIQCIKTKFR